MAESKALCISVISFGWYEAFAPLYIYAALRSYPDAFVKIFVTESLSAGVRAKLDVLKDAGIDRFEIHEYYQRDITSHFGASVIAKALHTISIPPKSWRWLIPETYFDGFEYAYIGDIDLLLLRETPSLADQHVEHCKSIGLPYSNALRLPKGRLTGLHFVDVKPYYAAMRPVLQRTVRRPGISLRRWRLNNERHLCMLVEQALDLPDMSRGWFRPHHGVHLGILRGENPQGSTLQPLQDVIDAQRDDIVAMLESPVTISLRDGLDARVETMLQRLERMLESP